ncbi:MAG TPA: methyl-accepting chemotaxis protein [Thermodesulfovibrionales bacterium]|nr:methyl-accepting chemotaxis protein [Thermodesulfovibrionales bacterium]
MKSGKLQKKAVLAVAGILFLIIGVNTAVLTYVASNKYKNAILAKSNAVGDSLQRDLGRALSLGVPLESIDGVNEKLQELMSRDKAVGYAMVIDANRKVLFHTQQSSLGKELKDDVSAKAASSTKMLTQKAGSFYDLSFPLTNAEGKIAGALRLGIKSEEINSQLYALLFWALGISAVSFLVSLIVVFFSISRFITLPIMGMEKAAERVAAGDLTSAVTIRGNDEIASLGSAINRMAFNLKDMLSKIRNVTNGVSQVTANIVTSSQSVLAVADLQKRTIEVTSVAISEMNDSTSSVAVSAESLSDSAVETSSAMMQMAKSIESVADNANVFYESAQETAASIEEMISSIKQISQSLENLSLSSDEIASSTSEVNATVKEIEDHANKSVELAEKVMTDASDRGISAANAAMEGMENIRKSVGALSDVINVLGKRSGDIGEILNVIDDIADQTHLLALNAAILAAQAGEHGRAFAVVADEIKSLAERTSVSTKEIAELITSVQDDTRSSVEMAGEGIRTVEQGLKLVQEVNTALGGIVESSQVATEMSKAIQRATSEESQVIKQITEATKGMSKQVENISVALQEQSRGSRFIIDATEKMKEISHQVKIAIGEQKSGSKQIAGAIENVTQQAGQIAKATGRQKQKNTEIVQSMDKIQNTTGNLIDSADAMSAGISSLKEEAQNLLLELQKFTV